MMICGSGQLGGDSSSYFRMIGLHRLGEMGSAWVKTWRIRQFKKKCEQSRHSEVTCLVGIPVHGVLDPVRAVVVVAAPHHRHVLAAHVPQLALRHHVDLVLGAVHVVEVGQGGGVQPGELEDLVAGLVAVVSCWGVVLRLRGGGGSVPVTSVVTVTSAASSRLLLSKNISRV